MRKLKSRELQGHIESTQQELEASVEDRKVDVLSTRKSKLEKDLRKIEQGELPEIGTYIDLADLPCILVLREKGKMGDTFPPSLRFYDLRLRHANPDDKSPTHRASIEQDLGRACGYENGDSLYPMPLVLVPTTCLKKLRQEACVSQLQGHLVFQASSVQPVFLSVPTHYMHDSTVRP